MPTMPDPRAALVCRRLSLQVGAGPDVLVRVLVLLRRRQCRIATVAFGRDRFELTVLAPPRAASRLEAWLMGLVDVHGVSGLVEDAADARVHGLRAVPEGGAVAQSLE